MGAEADFGIIGSVQERARLIAELSELLIECLKLQNPAPPITDEERIIGGRLGLDSVDAAQWVTTVERHFSLELTDGDLIAGALESLGNLADILIKAGVHTGTPPVDN
jgi:acyl carrier protein